jgi:hypothetical protein
MDDRRTAWYKGWVFGCLLAGIAGSNPTRGMDVCLLSRVVCCQVDVSGSGRSLVQRSPTERAVSEECHREDRKGEGLARNRVEAPQGKKKVDEP